MTKSRHVFQFESEQIRSIRNILSINLPKQNKNKSLIILYTLINSSLVNSPLATINDDNSSKKKISWNHSTKNEMTVPKNMKKHIIFFIETLQKNPYSKINYSLSLSLTNASVCISVPSFVVVFFPPNFVFKKNSNSILFLFCMNLFYKQLNSSHSSARNSPFDKTKDHH